MYFDTKSIGGGIEILASNDYQAVPVTITESAAVKGGTPVTQDGKKAADGSNAIGILLYDVDPTVNPNGAAVVDGIVNWDKCKTNAPDSATAEITEIAKALPNIVFRDKDGKTYSSVGAGA